MEKKAFLSRDKSIDYLKGFAIILVVLGHAYFPLRKYIYLFHVAVFFITSGFCQNTKYSDNLRQVINLFKKRFFSLWVPYFMYNLIFLIFQNILIRVGIYTTDINSFSYNFISNDGFVEIVDKRNIIDYLFRSLLFINARPLVGGLWFLGGLFYITIMFTIIDYFCKIISKRRFVVIHFIISCISLCIGFLVSIGYFKVPVFGKYISIVFSCEILFFLGQRIYNYRVYLRKWYLLLLSLLCLIVLGQFGTISIASIKFVNPLFFVFSSLTGFIFLYTLSSIVSKYNYLNIVEKIGFHTITILALHTFSFKIVTVIQIWYYKFDPIVLTALPVWKSDNLWWILHGVVGVFLPFTISIIYNRITLYIKKCSVKKEIS